MENSKITIGDIAEALGISKTTVSRAISGKGRIGEETVKKVQDYIKEHDYHPNPMAKGLANSRTYNIAWVMPGDSNRTDLPFFQRCMIGITSVASESDYDVLMSLVYDDDISSLERVIKNSKVDGVILGRTLVDDPRIRLLNASTLPFVAIGSSSNDSVIQIDNDHVKACSELTSSIILKGIRKTGLIGGTAEHVVNRHRLEGYKKALEHNNIKFDSTNVFMDSESNTSVCRAVDECLKHSVECIICTDDRICEQVMDYLKLKRLAIPDDIKVASFYNSSVLDNYNPPITTLKYDPLELGKEACRVLLDKIDGIAVKHKTLMDYEVLMRGSTN
ncbi:MAG: LacI family DNA-binding transcriptional regulator [Lachnospiraceae bacterium]|nr:LacI family DNA-binding transcriptional regulator [Candidatus Colinaster scatohippi]